MADQNKQPDIEALLKETMDRLALAEIKIEALETAVVAGATPAATEAVAQKPAAKVTMTGETFKVGKKTYRLKYPHFDHNGKHITEADVLESKALQTELVEGKYGVIAEVTD